MYCAKVLSVLTQLVHTYLPKKMSTHTADHVHEYKCTLHSHEIVWYDSVQPVLFTLESVVNDNLMSVVKSSEYPLLRLPERLYRRTLLGHE